MPLPSSSVSSLSLAGVWRLRLDREDRGVAERWFAREIADLTIPLPGSLPGHGIGDPVTLETPWVGSIFDPSYFTSAKYAPYREPGNIKVPFWLQPETYYAGVAWYQRDIQPPADRAGRRLVLRLERPHWQTTVWLGERLLGVCDSLSVAHEHELPADLGAGPHRLTVRVDNRMLVDLGKNSHSISDHTQGNWNGIVGALELRAGPITRAEDVRVYPDFKHKRVEVRGVVRGPAGSSGGGEIAAAVGPRRVATTYALADGLAEFALELDLGPDAAEWDEFTPALHDLDLTVTPTAPAAPGGAAAPGPHRTTIRFGLREIGRDGRQLLINGRPLFLRGALDCATYPRTGHPPTDLASWRAVLGVIRTHGLNHVRFHSWCPPEAAFAAADELGLYLQVEVASWPNQGTVIGDDGPLDAWIDAETERISLAYGNHPSLVLMCACNEPDGPRHQAWLGGWILRRKARDPRPLYTAGAGWPEVPENEFHIRSEPRVQHWGEGLDSRLNALPPETATDYAHFIAERAVPVVSHEIGQWCAYPNYREMAKYTGYLKPRNFEIFRASLAANGLLAQADEFLHASGKLQALCYKEDIEAALRTDRMGGFQLLGLADFSGQGTALVGVLDAFWEEKGYIRPDEFRRFCAPTVPLARLRKRVFTTDETLETVLDLAHFGAAPLAAVTPEWRLLDASGASVRDGRLATTDIEIGLRSRIGRIALPLADLVAPARYRLEVVVALGDGREAANDWNIWLYPAVVAETVSDALVTERLDETARRRLADGGTVWLALRPGQVAPDPDGGPVALGFTSIFWNTAWTNGQAPHTLGLRCDPAHPALAGFPTDAHSDWHWWHVVSRAAAMILTDLPHELRPIVQVIDDWYSNRRLGLVIECKVGRGRLIVCGADLMAADDPVNRQLLASLLRYMGGATSAPTVSLEPAQVHGLLATIPLRTSSGN